MALPIDTSVFGLPILLFGAILCAYGVWDMFSRGGLTASGIIHILLGFILGTAGGIMFVVGGGA